MLHVLQRSIVTQLLVVYLLFVVVILVMVVGVNAAVQQQVRSAIGTTDASLGQEVALDTSAKVHSVQTSLFQLGQLDAVRRDDRTAMIAAFHAFQVAQPSIALVSWLSPRGRLLTSFPINVRTLGKNVGIQQGVVVRAAHGTGPVVGEGVVDLTTNDAVATFAQPVRDGRGRLRGILVANLRLDELSEPLDAIIAAQTQAHQHLLISIVDASGHLIATSQQERLLQPALDELPGASAALGGRTVTTQGADAGGDAWLYAAVPVSSVGWAVVVQRLASDVLASETYVRTWLIIAIGLFVLGGLIFWLVLFRRVVRPLHALVARYAALPSLETSSLDIPFAHRVDQIGHLARSLDRLERNVNSQLGEMRTLLETSNSVVTSLDPSAVARSIIHEVQRLADIQAAAVLVPDDEGVLRVLSSDGRAENYDDAVRIPADDLAFPSALALHEQRVVQFIEGDGNPFPPISYAEGFRAVLAVPIISRHVGGVVLVVHRTRPQEFTAHEIDLLLTFANYATLAWEHAVLYERTDERLREAARENELLYRRTAAEKQTQDAVMHSMADGLILTSMDGTVLYANRAATDIVGVAGSTIIGDDLDALHDRLGASAQNPAQYDERRRRAESGVVTSWLLESDVHERRLTVNLRLFDVRDDNGGAIGRGLLLRDVTREHELDAFKTTLLGAVGHELRTPLAAIKGYASTLLQQDVAWSEEDQRLFLGTISSEADRLALLVSNLLDLSRLEAGLLPLNRAPCHLCDVLAGAVRRLPQPLHSLVVDLPNDLPLLDIDAARIDVVLHNLIANALAYGNGQVRIVAAAADDAVTILVADDGPGIGEAELPHIFERFYRARYGQHRRSGGTGMGLAICKAFVEAHGGLISARSGSRGTTISFSLPLAARVVRDSADPVHQVESRGILALNAL